MISVPTCNLNLVFLLWNFNLTVWLNFSAEFLEICHCFTLLHGEGWCLSGTVDILLIFHQVWPYHRATRGKWLKLERCTVKEVFLPHNLTCCTLLLSGTVVVPPSLISEPGKGLGRAALCSLSSNTQAHMLLLPTVCRPREMLWCICYRLQIAWVW